MFKYLSQLSQLSLVDEIEPQAKLFYPITNCYQLITSLITDRLYDLRVSYQRIENFKKLLEEFFKKYFIQNQQVDNTTNIKADI